MTEAMSSGDIDRVLANIRKLVSVEDEAGPKHGGRLVLTSDLRVADPQGEAAQFPRKGAEGATEDAVEARSLVEEDAGWPDLDLPRAAEDRPSAFEVVTEQSARPKSLEERIADLQMAIGADPSVEFEPDGSEDQAQHMPERMPSIRPKNVVPVASDAGRDAMAEDAARAPSHSEESLDARPDHSRFYDDTSFPGAEDLGETPEERLEQGSADMSDLRFVHSSTEGRTENEPHQHREDPRPADHDEQVLDEEALREFVAEIVREELAGALGERITRNVRKLVRREIMRALSARDFE